MSFLDKLFYSRENDRGLSGRGEVPDSLKPRVDRGVLVEEEGIGIEYLNNVRSDFRSYNSRSESDRVKILSNRVVVTALDKISRGIDRVDIRVRDEAGDLVEYGLEYGIANEELYGADYNLKDLLKLIRIDLLLYGNSVILPIRSVIDSEVISFRKLDMDRVTFTGDIYTGVGIKYMKVAGEFADDQVEYGFDDMIHITTSVKDDRGVGIPEASKFWDDLVMYDSLTRLEYGIVESGGITPVHFSTDVGNQRGKDLKSYLVSIKEYLTGMLSSEGTYNNKILVTSSDVELSRFVGDIRELEITEKLGKYSNNIITSMQLHPSDVGDTDNSTYNNEQIRMVEFWEIAVLPFVEDVLAKLSLDLGCDLVVEVPELEEARIKVDTKSLQDSEVLYNTSRSIKILLESGVLDVDGAKDILERGVDIGE